MRTTLALDDDLLAKAQAFTGLKEKSALVREALTALGQWLQQGKLKFRLDTYDGLEHAVITLRKLYTGENTGKLMVKVA